METKQQISEDQALEMYKEELDETKREWIENYYGGDALKEIDPIAFDIGFRSFCDNLEDRDMELIEEG